MTRTVHMCLSVRGALANWRFPRDFTGVLRDDAGRHLSPHEARDALRRCLRDGIEVVVVGGPCEGFDPVTGCPGHDTA